MTAHSKSTPKMRLTKNRTGTRIIGSKTPRPRAKRSLSHSPRNSPKSSPESSKTLSQVRYSSRTSPGNSPKSLSRKLSSQHKKLSSKTSRTLNYSDGVKHKKSGRSGALTISLSLVEINLTKKSTNRLESIYKQHKQGRMNLRSFTECIKSLGLINNKDLSLADIPKMFSEVISNSVVADFDAFLQVLSTVAIKRFPDGICDDASAALERLVNAIPKEVNVEVIREKQLAVYEAKKRAAQRARKIKQKQLETKGKAIEQEKNEQEKNEQEKNEQENKEKETKQNEISRQRAYLRAKAKIQAQKERERKEEEEKKRNEQDSSEKRLVIAKIRAQAMTQSKIRAQQRLMQYRKAEDEARAAQLALVSTWGDKAELADNSVQKAAARVKAAKKARQEQESLQKLQEEKEKKAQMELSNKKSQMSAIIRASKRLKAKLKAEQRELEREKRHAKEKEDKEAKKVSAAVARAVKRTSVVKEKLTLSDEDKQDLHKMFDPLAHKDIIYNARWHEFILKHKLCDNMNLNKSDIDTIYSKCTKKGMKGLEFRSFCKAVSMVGNTRYPVKGCTNPNDAIARVFQVTVRKRDPEEIRRRRSELRQKQKEFVAEQRTIEKRKQKAEAKEAKLQRREAEHFKKSREKRIRELQLQLEISKKEQKERAKKRAIAEQQKEMKKLQEIEQARKEKLALMEEKIVLEKQSREAQEQARVRLKAHAKKEQKKAERQQKLKEEKEAISATMADEGRKKAISRLRMKKKQEITLGTEDTNNLLTLYNHYKSGSGFKRADWFNCTETLGLRDGALVTKKNLDEFFQNVMNVGASGITFVQFCSAMGHVAQNTHPGEEENSQDDSPTKCLERLMFDIMGDPSENDELIEFNPTLDDSYLEGYEETEEEKTVRLVEEKAAKKVKREERKQRKREAQAIAEEEARIEMENEKVKLETIQQARNKAANRVKKRKKEQFSVNEQNTEHLVIFYEYFRILPSGMSRGDWLNCVSTVGIQDDAIIYKADCEEIFNEICKTRTLSFHQFCVGLSLLAQMKYHEEQISQTKALSRLTKTMLGE